MPKPAFVEVAFPLPLNRTFHYQRLDPSPSNGHLLGARVLAPFGKKNLIGYVVGTTDQKPSFPTRPVSAWLDSIPFIDSNLLELARWLSETYLCSLGEALACMAPPRLRAPKRRQEASSKQQASERGKSEEASSPACGSLLARSLNLSVDQQRALEQLLAAVDEGRYRPFLLHGITDSGKTELYVRTIDRALECGKQALFLLPEIALTPPFIDQLKTRYSEARVGVWHSGIRESGRYGTWQGVQNGEIRVLLGARSAVFAPFAHLGVVVLDEEHEPTYKQEDRPRYHTRDVALRRAQQTQAVLIMGSATPSLESYWNARQGIYTLLELTSRVEKRSLPPVTLIDRRPTVLASSERASKQEGDLPSSPARRLAGSRSFAVFSEPLRLAIEQRLARHEQIMLFINRRGYTPFLRCSSCGWVARCKRCSLAMAVHHGSTERRKLKELGPQASGLGAFLQCHACLRQEPVMIQCPQCQGMRLRQFGIGTQRVEEEVKKLFPFVKTARLDRDVTRYRRAHETIYQDFARGERDILVGTQMIAKGFHFSRVTLVGIVDADVALHLPDFRSAERTFELIAQVAGRAGRGGSPGQVLVQTHHPDHYALQAAKDHDYPRFYAEEVKYRVALHYPPFCRLINILVRGSKEAVVQSSAEQLYNGLVSLRSPSLSVGDGSKGEVDILGPTPAPYSRLRRQFRYQILLKGTEATLAPYKEFLRGYRLPKAFMSVDVDPMDLL
jgi:primosomal protein N' (replication factor Y)